MDIATIGARLLRRRGLLKNIDLSEEVNASPSMWTQMLTVTSEDWLLMLKRDHNHPTEIEPYGGAATCIGGAIRDPVRQEHMSIRPCASRVGDPRAPLESRCPQASQRKLTVTAAGLFILRQPDRAGNGSCPRNLPPRLYRQAHGGRRSRRGRES